MKIKDTLDFLLGDWELERSISDHLAAREGLFAGSATLRELTPEETYAIAATVRYDEVGELRFGEMTTRASRSLLYGQLGDAAAMLYFLNESPYVDLDLSSGAWHSSHPCGEDLYQITTTVDSANQIREAWRVVGPNKHYDAITTLTRSHVC